MAVRSQTRQAHEPPQQPNRDPKPQTPMPVPKVVRDATDRFIRRYGKTLKDLERY
jgi:hypothetical protein